MNAIESTSTRPYLIRALYDWCTDNGFTPYVAVLVDDTSRATITRRLLTWRRRF